MSGGEVVVSAVPNDHQCKPPGMLRCFFTGIHAGGVWVCNACKAEYRLTFHPTSGKEEWVRGTFTTKYESKAKFPRIDP